MTLKAFIGFWLLVYAVAGFFLGYTAEQERTGNTAFHAIACGS